MLNKFGWEDKVYKRLNEFLNADGKDTYCVFVFDNTCVIHDIQEVTYNYMIDNLVFKMDKITFATNLKKDVAGEEKIYSVFGVDRKNNPDTKMEFETVAGGCESSCVRMTCEPTPGPRGRDNCVCDEKSWRRTPVRLLLGSRIANEVIFRSHPDARFQNSVSYDGDTGEDQVLWDSIAGSEIRL